MQFVKFYVISINLLTFGLFVLDKWLAGRKRVRWRIPENRLLLASVIGGSLGALAAMQLVRHKTQKIKFKWGIPAILLIQGAVIAFFIRQLVD
ncbi:uncharacterized membrane protein YsdA (DUF1294 family) [Desulfohalotomaculum tongense]|uniref:DUF1294 domain-containing protein n=1 Tax=Desulforadius tongensis TaxID=1216062 RepID=UPI00195D3E7F|nr:DUF1294 domain-containing protein [Desulforadius tongensis]MBM7855419.1 uncharacterized membrane protein YsdA (DUF1294 family) [Desulforadius tongensis]